ncbi:MAG: glycosyltransferase family 2 protein [Ignavibacteriae bacterium]|nr:glycosyltransferase family 2 protein [Ignavibacteria bacterium]MBI3365755.1 glycosyltransferase family 2 protein [Ignavibacteriota bacterium]
MNPSIAVIIPTYNNKARLRTALSHWQRVDYDNFKLIVINDGCTDGTKELLKSEFPHVIQLFGDGNLWYAGCCNEGLRYALDNNFDYGTVFNDDIYVDPEILKAQVECARNYRGAMLGIKSYKWGTDKILWSVGGYVTKRFIGLGLTFPGKNQPDDGSSFEEEFEVEILDGAGQFYPLSIVRAIGFWDERYKAYYADVEYPLRARRKGFRLISNPKAIAWHDYEESEIILKNIKRYRFHLLYLLFNKKSNYNIVNVCRFWFTYFPLSASLTVVRFYAGMIKTYYINPIMTGKQPVER